MRVENSEDCKKLDPILNWMSEGDEWILNGIKQGMLIWRGSNDTTNIYSKNCELFQLASLIFDWDLLRFTDKVYINESN